MPTTITENLSPTRVKLIITVGPDELKPSLDHAYKHIAEQVSIPGFRKGKVPPPIIDQRVGRGEVLNHAVSEGLDRFFKDAVTSEGIRPIGRPDADVTAWPSDKDFSGDLVVTVEVDVRPEFDLPDYASYTLEVEPVVADKKAVQAELDALRERFGTLVTVDRPIATGDFVQIDLTASIAGDTIDSATSISYEVGSGQLIGGIDDALDTLTAGESATFESKLLGGDHEGDTAQIDVTVLAVKERELPQADDDFAQIASQFDTIAELTDDLKKEVERKGRMAQAQAARSALVDKLVADAAMPVPESAVEGEVNRHLEQEGRLDDSDHRKEVVESTEKSLRTQFVLDKLSESLDVQVSQDELTSYLIQAAANYGMEPGEFIQTVDRGGQLPQMVSEVARAKSLTLALQKVTITDTKGKKVDLSEFFQVSTGQPAFTLPDEAHDHDHDH